MKKFLLSLVVLTVSIAVQADMSIVTAPTLYMGTATYVSDNTGKASVITDIPSTGNIRIQTTDGGPLGDLTNTSVTAATFSGMDPKLKNVYVEISPRTSGTVTGSCGTLNIQDISLAYGGATSATLKASSDTQLVNYPNGLYIAMTASLAGQPSTPNCTISAPIEGVVLRFANARNKNQAVWHETNIYVSLDLISSHWIEHPTGGELNFGTFCASSQPQTLTVTPTGGIGSSNVSCPVDSANISADRFVFHSTPGTSFSVNLPASATLSNATDGSLTITNFSSSCIPSCVLSTQEQEFTVGGTITVPGNSPIGEYTGSYPVSVTY